MKIASFVLAGAIALAAPPEASKLPTIKFTDTKLDNGLRIIVSGVPAVPDSPICSST